MVYQQAQAPSEYSWLAREVIQEIDSKPHLLVAVEISGPYFPQRALTPFAQILPSEGKPISSWFARISDDNRKLTAYFPVDVPESGTIEFGYGHQPIGRVASRFEGRRVERLERNLMPADVVLTREEHMKERRSAK
jgi:hypothetical protein